MTIKIADTPVKHILRDVFLLFIFLGVVALIVLPRPCGNSRKAKESTIKANLILIRNATDEFKTDTGVYPQKLTDLSATQAPAYVEAEKYKGPYLNNLGGIKDNGAIPRNPYVPSADSDVSHHWSYTATSASVTISFPTPVGTDSNGDPYSGY